MVSTTIVCSIYIHNRDETRERKTLEWYHNITKSAGTHFKLWLINDGSEKNLSKMLAAMRPKGYCTEIRYFDSKVREGKAKKLNKLLNIADTKYVAVLDNDVILPQTWLVGCIQLCDRPGIALCGVLVENDLPAGPIKHDPRHSSFLPLYFPLMMGGACLVWNRQKLGMAGRFNESFGVYGHEDIEFIQRLTVGGNRCAAITSRGHHLKYHDDFKEYDTWKKQIMSRSLPIAEKIIMPLKKRRI